MSIKICIILSICSLFLHNNCIAQIITGTASQEKQKSFKTVQKQFETWRANKNLAETKGWKWFKRWEQHYAERANPDGTLADPAVFYEAALAYERANAIGKRSNNNNWLPVGPDVLPPSLNASSGHGMGRINCVTFHPSDPNTFWVGVAQGGIWKTSNGGQSWLPLNDGLPILRISAIAVDPNNAAILYACLGDFEYNAVALDLDDRKRHTHYGIGVYKSTNGGLSWTPTGHTLQQTQLDYSLLRSIFVDPNNSNHVVIGGFEGIWRSTDAGATWTNTKPNTIISDMEQDPINPSVLYAATASILNLQIGTAGVLKSIDFGATWTTLSTGIPPTDSTKRVELAIAASDPNYVYALACNREGGFFGLYRTVDGGTTWTEQANAYNSPNILSWDTGTGTRGQGSYDLCLLVDPNNREQVYTGGVNIWGSLNGGQDWGPISYWVNNYGQSVHADHHQLNYNPLDDKFYTCNDGGIMRTDSMIITSWDSIVMNGQNFPTVWQNISDGMQITSFYRLGVDNGRVIAGAQDNSTFYYNGSSWLNVIGGDGMQCFFHPTDPNIFWGSWQYGGLARTTNGGASFNYYLQSPITNGEEGEWTTPFHYSEQAGALYAGYGNLWKSIDNGDNWTALSNFSNMPSATFPAPASALAQCTNNKNVLYMAKRIYHSYNVNAEMWVTMDEGGTWTNITTGLPDSLYFTYIAVDDDNPSIAWVTCSGFTNGEKVYKTTDGGVTWQNISNNLPNIPINTVVVDEASSDHTIYIGTDLGVYYTNDNLSSWQLHGVGLPNVIVGDLEIDYDNRDLYVATFGRGIWKIDLAAVTGVEQPALQQANIGLSPNPNQGVFNLSIDIPVTFQGKVVVSDIMGRQVHEQAIDLVKGEQTVPLALDLETGVYFLQIKDKQNTQVLKFTVQP